MKPLLRRDLDTIKVRNKLWVMIDVGRYARVEVTEVTPTGRVKTETDDPRLIRLNDYYGEANYNTFVTNSRRPNAPFISAGMGLPLMRANTSIEDKMTENWAERDIAAQDAAPTEEK